MASARNCCALCDARIDPYGRDGTRCERCSQPCPTCDRDPAYCAHPLTELKRDHSGAWFA